MGGIHIEILLCIRRRTVRGVGIEEMGEEEETPVFDRL